MTAPPPPGGLPPPPPPTPPKTQALGPGGGGGGGVDYGSLFAAVRIDGAPPRRTGLAAAGAPLDARMAIPAPPPPPAEAGAAEWGAGVELTLEHGEGREGEPALGAVR